MEQVQGGREEVETAGLKLGLQPGERLQQLLKERNDLRELLNEQLETTSVHTARINGMEGNLMDMQNATKLASQVSHPKEGAPSLAARTPAVKALEWEGPHERLWWTACLIRLVVLPAGSS